MPSAADLRPHLLGASPEELAVLLAPIVDRPFRAKQLYQAIHRRQQVDFAAMSELSQGLRAELAARFRLDLPAVAERQAASDGTVKVLFRLDDGASIEAVDIPDVERRTFCLSSQAGCALACRFCVTGFWGAGRNLTAAEIVGQVFALRAQAPEGERLNLVFMGMGEPLLNLEALRPAIERLSETVSWRRITVSTAGVVPGIDEIGRWPERPNLAVSLHAPDDERRSALMPINRSYPLAELVAALRRFPLEPRRRLTVEYLLLAGYNDRPADADALSRRLAGLKAKINLIPLNPDPVLPEGLAPSTPAAVTAFQERLAAKGWTVTVRRRRGDEAAAACGQLRAFAREPRGFRRSQLSF